jgi:hypothetical protein
MRLYDGYDLWSQEIDQIRALAFYFSLSTVWLLIVCSFIASL